MVHSFKITVVNDKCSLRRKNIKSMNIIISMHEDKFQRGREEFPE